MQRNLHGTIHSNKNVKPDVGWNNIAIITQTWRGAREYLIGASLAK